MATATTTASEAPKPAVRLIVVDANRRRGEKGRSRCVTISGDAVTVQGVFEFIRPRVLKKFATQ